MQRKFYIFGVFLLWSSCLATLPACGEPESRTAISMALATPTQFVARAEIDLAVFEGLTEIEPIPRMAESTVYKYNVKKFREWQFISDQSPKQAAQTIDTALKKAGYVFAIPPAKQPYYLDSNKAYNGGYRRDKEVDDLMVSVYVPAAVLQDFAQVKTAAPEFYAKYFTQLETTKSYIMIMAAPDLLTILGNAALTKTPAAQSSAGKTPATAPAATPTLK